MTRWEEIKAKRAEQDPELYDRIERERQELKAEPDTWTRNSYFGFLIGLLDRKKPRDKKPGNS